MYFASERERPLKIIFSCYKLVQGHYLDKIQHITHYNALQRSKVVRELLFLLLHDFSRSFAVNVFKLSIGTYGTRAISRPSRTVHNVEIRRPTAILIIVTLNVCSSSFENNMHMHLQCDRLASYVTFYALRHFQTSVSRSFS